MGSGNEVPLSALHGSENGGVAWMFSTKRGGRGAKLSEVDDGRKKGVME